MFLFQATDRHAGLATIQCRNESTNSKDFALRIKLIVKPSELQALSSLETYSICHYMYYYLILCKIIHNNLVDDTI